MSQATPKQYNGNAVCLEIKHFPRALTDEEHKAVEEYLRIKWNLAKIMKEPHQEKSPIHVLARELDMPVDQVRCASRQMAKERRLREKIEAILSGNSGILPTGEIVDRRKRPEARSYL